MTDHRPESENPTGAAEGELVLHEEQLRAAVHHRPVRRVVLRKRVVEEQRQVTVTVRREVADVFEEDVTDAPVTAGALPATGPAEVDIVLYAEEPVVQLRAVPVERVRLEVTRVSEEVPVSAEVARERADLDVEGTAAAGQP